MKQEYEFHAGALPGHTNPDDEAERLPLNYVQLIIRYKWRLLAGLLMGVFVGHLMYLKFGPEYEAFVEILVSRKYAAPLREDDKMLKAGSLPSEHIKLIQSPMIANEAVKIGSLQDLKTFLGEPDLADVVLESLKVKRVSGQDRSSTNIFDIRYNSKNASDASKVLDAVISAYEDYLKSSSSEQSREVLQAAQTATKAMKDQLDQKELDYNQFIQRVPAEFRSALGSRAQPAQTQTNVAPQDEIQTYGEERTKNRIRMAELKSRQLAVEQAIAAGESRESLENQVRRFLMATDGHGTDSAGKSTEINIYQSQLIPLLLKKRDLERDFGPDWPDLKSVRGSIETIVQTYRKLGVQLPEGIDSTTNPQRTKPAEVDLVALYLADVKRQLVELKIKEESLDSLIAFEQNKSKEFAEYQAEERNRRNELDSVRELWTKQVEVEQKVALEKDSNGYQMRRLSSVKHGLVVKRMMKFYAAGAALCLFMIALTCVIHELADLTIKTVRDVRDIVRHPVLGSVCQYVVPTDFAGPTSGIPHPALRYLHSPSSTEAETYRTIRASLLVTCQNLEARSLMITSPEPGDGKTTLACNLAVALAQSGKKVLLIDGDLRRPAVHRMFRIPQGTGLTEVLAGTASFQEVVRASTVDRLSIMTTGKPTANPGEILSSTELRGILQRAKEEYDFVFVDTPPLLAVSDPCVIARNTDGILLVARMNKNPRSALIRVRQLLNDQELPIIGAVVNGVPQKGGHEYGYTYYGEYVAPSTPAASRKPLAGAGKA